MELLHFHILLYQQDLINILITTIPRKKERRRTIHTMERVEDVIIKREIITIRMITITDMTTNTIIRRVMENVFFI